MHQFRNRVSLHVQLDALLLESLNLDFSPLNLALRMGFVLPALLQF
jgi:hypothetical protein